MKETPNSVISSENLVDMYLQESSYIYTSGSQNCVLGDCLVDYLISVSVTDVVYSIIL
jgi:hypothetical protein